MATTTRGSSFARAGSYFLLPAKGAATREPVAWAATLDVRTQDPEAALAWPARHAEELKRAAGVPTGGGRSGWRATRRSSCGTGTSRRPTCM